MPCIYPLLGRPTNPNTKAHPAMMNNVPSVCASESRSPSKSVPTSTATTVTTNSTLMVLVAPMVLTKRK